MDRDRSKGICERHEAKPRVKSTEGSERQTREKLWKAGNFGELTFILLFLHVKQPVLVRRLIS